MSVNLGESRSELLHWLNNLLDLNYTKVEQCGTGAVYCQIIDSIYGDVPMGKVSFTANFDYEYISNYKVLQSAFAKHGITKVVPVERLIKCKLQDNLEFLQWLKRYWVEHKDETEYDPNLRRKALPRSVSGSGSRSAASTGSRSGSSLNNARSTVGSARVRSTQSARTTAPVASKVKSNTPGLSSSASSNKSGVISTPSSRLYGTNSNSVRPKAGPSVQSVRLQKELDEAQSELIAVTDELNEYKVAAEGLETERNFYFNKLRDIEILSQAITDQLSEEAEKQHQQQLNGQLSNDVLSNNQSLIEFVEKIQDILYSTEEGFQVPDEEPQNELENGHQSVQQPIDEESF